MTLLRGTRERPVTGDIVHAGGALLSVEVRPRAYHDSIVLMQASARMLEAGGVEAAMAAMATPLNLAVLRESGLWAPELEVAGPGDLVLAARGADPAAALRAGGAALAPPARPGAGAGSGPPPRTIRTAARWLPGAHLAPVSVPGEHAAWAWWGGRA